MNTETSVSDGRSVIGLRGRRPTVPWREWVAGFESDPTTVGNWFYVHVAWLGTPWEFVTYAGQSSIGAESRSLGHVDPQSAYHKPYFEAGGGQVVIVPFRFPDSWSQERMDRFEGDFIQAMAKGFGQCPWNLQYNPNTVRRELTAAERAADPKGRKFVVEPNEEAQAARDYVMSRLGGRVGWAPWVLWKTRLYARQARVIATGWVAITTGLVLFGLLARAVVL